MSSSQIYETLRGENEQLVKDYNNCKKEIKYLRFHINILLDSIPDTDNFLLDKSSDSEDEYSRSSSSSESESLQLNFKKRKKTFEAVAPNPNPLTESSAAALSSPTPALAQYHPNSDNETNNKNSKEKKFKPLPVDEQGQVMLPVVLGRAIARISIYNIGEIPLYSKNYHDLDYIYPVGFLSKRKFYGLSDGTKKLYYTCKILEDGESGPLFQIIPQQEHLAVMESKSLSRLFETFMDKFDGDTKTDSEWPIFYSGQDFFGLEHPGVKKYIEELPGASTCSNYYKFIKVEWEN